MSNPPIPPPPGWYPDPQSPTMLRWWDGGTWTNDIRPVDQSPTPGDGGARLRPVGDWMTETFRLMIGNAGGLLTLAVVLVVPAALLSGYALWAGVRDLVIVTNDDPGPGESFIEFQNAGSLGWFALAFAANVVLSMFFSIAGTRLAFSNRFGPALSWDAALTQGVRRFFPWLGWLIVASSLAFVVMVALAFVAVGLGIVNPFLGAIAGLAAFGCGVVLAARYSMMFSSPMVAARGSRNPGVVHRITEGSTSGLLGRFLLLILVTIAASFAGSILSSPLSAIGGGEAVSPDADVIRIGEVLGDNAGLFMLVQLMNGIVVALVGVMWHVGMCLLFDDLGGEVDPQLRTDRDIRAGVQP